MRRGRAALKAPEQLLLRALTAPFLMIVALLRGNVRLCPVKQTNAGLAANDRFRGHNATFPKKVSISFFARFMYKGCDDWLNQR